MRSDMKALLKVFGGSFLVALVILGILTAAALDLLSREAAVGLTLVVFVVGALVLGRVFTRALMTRATDREEDIEGVARR
jgi:hypothetical protein